MANETLITDLVAQEAMQQLEQLDRAMEGTLQQFQNCARELAQGLKIPVEVTGDVDALRTLTNSVMREASQATQQLTQQLQQQQQVVANTTNTISRQLQAQENLNKAQREAFVQDQEAQRLANALLGTRQQNYELMSRYNSEMKGYKDAIKKVNEEEKNGLITQEQAIQRRATLMASYDKTKIAAQELQRILNAQNKEANAVDGSYAQLSQRLELLRKAYKQMTDAEKASVGGQEIEKAIQNYDARLKDLDADMGQHQRNVGNYAIAAQNMKGTLRELTEEIAQLTLQYNELSDEEQRSDVGMQLRDKITELTEQAGKYKDVISDVKQSISGSASDTRLFDSLIEAGQVFAATMGVAETACRALGMSEDNLQKSMLKVQQAMQAVQALQVIQNTLQKQSNLMKGVAILQSKAAAAAAKIEAAATASATGATKAQTVAQAAFNAVAKANPYVLLATAILAVIGVIVGYTAATKDATAADEEAKKAAEERQQQMSSFAESYAQSAAELIVKFETLRDKWNELGDNIKAREKLLKDNKTILDEIGVATNNVNAADIDFNKRTDTIRTNLKRRAEAQAAYALMIQTTIEKLKRLKELELQEFQGIQQGVTMRGARVDELVRAGASKESFKWLGGQSDMFQVVNANDVNKVLRAEFDKQQEAERKKIEEYYDKIYQSYEAKYNANKDALVEPVSAPTTPKQPKSPKSPKGKSGSGSGKNNPQVKSAEDIQNELNAIMLSGYTYAVGLEEEYSEKWLKAEKKRIKQAQENEIAEANKRLETLEKDINASKMSEEEKGKAIAKARAATQDIINGINKKAKDEEKALEDEITKYKKEMAHKSLVEKVSANEEEITIMESQNAQYLESLRQEYLGQQARAVGNEKELERIRTEYADRVAQEQIRHANAVAQKAIEQYEAILANEDLSAEDRKDIEEKLTNAKIDLIKAVNDEHERFIENQVQAEQDAAEKRKEGFDKWQESLQKVGEAMGNIGEFAEAMFDNQISKVEELIDAEQERYDKEINHISWLANRGAITTEEAEIRKRDAEEAHAKAQEALEKKKAAWEYKKAVAQKANQVAQIGISTALGIMQALAMFPPNIPLSVFVGAMGAIQLATALAQPIKAYAEGTKGKGHPGGLALVGDAYRPEVILHNGRAWITPDSPTLVDLPKGAEVMPDASKVDLMQMGSSLFMSMPRSRANGQPIIVNDYEALEGRVANNTKAVTQTLNRFERNVTRQMRRQKFNAYINART